MKQLLTFTFVFLICACEKQSLEEEKVRQPEKARTSEDSIKRLISDRLLTLNLGFIKHYGPEGEVTILCVADLINHTNDELVLPDRRFSDYENNVILNEDSQRPVETFANSSSTLGLNADLLVLSPWGEDRLQIYYEAFTCFQGTRFPNGSIAYEPNGTFIMFHREFPNYPLRFRFSDQGVIEPILDMKEQDAP
jgi:hypothetical protein